MKTLIAKTCFEKRHFEAERELKNALVERNRPHSLSRSFHSTRERKKERKRGFFLHKQEEEIFRDGEEGREAQLSFYFFQPLRLSQPTL